MSAPIEPPRGLPLLATAFLNRLPKLQAVA
jgi:hypothetical protein